VATEVRVGCAGWSIPGRYRTAFEAEGSALERYASRLSVAEINSSFYRAHQPATYARWAEAVPAHFRFTVKIPRAISHELRLRGTGALLDRFLDESGHLGDRLGGLLLQLPPSLAFDARVASTFFAMLRRRTAVPVACEPRHAGWFDEAAEALMDRHRIARVAADPPRMDAGARPAGARCWRYWRWHGSPRTYYSDYDEQALHRLAAEVRVASTEGHPSWVIFDNTAHGFATANALRLQALLEPAHA